MKRSGVIFAGLLVAIGMAGPCVWSQGTEPGSPGQSARPLPQPSLPAAEQYMARQNPFLGSVPSAQPVAKEMSLSLVDAVQRGLKYNLGNLLSQQDIRAARGRQRMAHAALLPNVTTDTLERAEEVNLAAYGFTGFPGVRRIVGPFGIFDTRIFVSQSILNFSAISNARAGSENLKAADFSYQNARDVVVTVVADLYLQALAGSSRIEAVRAQVDTAQALYNQAVSFKQTGVVPAIDALRAQVELEARQQQLIYFQNEFEKQKLNLARAIGLPGGQSFRLSDRVPYVPLPPMTLQETIARAYRGRSDYQSALAAVRAAEDAKKAARSELLPSVSVDGNFGDLGSRLMSSHETFTVAANLRFPIFQGGRIRGEILQADSLLRQRKAQLKDLRGRIEYEVRAAFLDLKASGDRVKVARSALDLARQQMAQARDRFAAGVTSNIEVVQAQEALATANENYIASTYAFNVAKTALARALGGAEKNYRQFLLGETH